MGQRAAAKPGKHAVLGAIVERCVACLDAPEPGGGNPDYGEDSTLGRGLMSRQNAALALRMLPLRATRSTAGCAGQRPTRAGVP